MPPVGFEPKILVGERPQTQASDRAATGIGNAPYILLVHLSDFAVRHHI
jgi:hypothetical protein